MLQIFFLETWRYEAENIFIFLQMAKLKLRKSFNPARQFPMRNAYENSIEGTTTDYKLVLELRAHANVNMIIHVER